MNTLSIQFHKLSFEKKKEKLITLLDQLKPSDDIFRQTMVCIKCTEVDEKFLDDTYKAIIEFWDFVVQYNYEKKQRKVQQHLKRIQEQEAQEKENMIPDFIF